MTLISDQVPPGNDWLVRRLSDLERQVRELQAGRRLERATIGAGGLRVSGSAGVRVDGGGRISVAGGGRVTVYGSDGYELILMGHMDGFSDGKDRSGLVAFRTQADGGKQAMSLYDGIWAAWDREGNIVMSTDEVSGQGIARPWLPVNWAGSDYTQWPGTKSLSYVGLCETALPKQQPKIFVRIAHTTDAEGTTGQMRLMCNGVQLGATANVSFAIRVTDIGPIALPGPTAFGDVLGLSVECRVTGGPGSVRAAVVASWTQQS